MAGGYPVPAGDDLGALVKQIREMRARLDELERPTGTQQVETVKYLKSLFTLTAADSGSTTWSSSDGAYQSGTSIAITVDRESLVRVSYTAQVKVLATSGSGGSSSTIYAGAFALDGTIDFGSVRDVAVNSYGSVGDGANVDFSFMLDFLMTLPVGAHTIEHQYKRFAIPASGGGSVSGTREGGLLTVQVIG